jgi:predicted secreted protein
VLIPMVSYPFYMQDIQVIAHCLINPNVQLKGLECHNHPDITGSIIQLPCPEVIYLGPKRWEITSEQLDIPNYRRFCRRILQPTADTIQVLYESGHSIRLVGVKGSPSCGTLTTSTGMEGGRLHKAGHSHIQGLGVFFQEIIRELENRGIEFNVDE